MGRAVCDSPSVPVGSRCLSRCKPGFLLFGLGGFTCKWDMASNTCQTLAFCSLTVSNVMQIDFD